LLTGLATLEGVPDGSQTLTIDPTSLPPYFVGPAPITIAVPMTSVLVPVQLPIGHNLPNTYMAFGDSITVGDGSTLDANGNTTGYRVPLQGELAAYFGGTPPTIIDEGIEATRTPAGAARIDATVAADTPAYTLIHYGTNDWYICNDGNVPVVPCVTIDNLRTIVQSVKAHNSLPILGTIIPSNVGYDLATTGVDGRTPPERNQWIDEIDALIITMGQQEGAVVADLHAAYLKAAGVDGLTNGDLMNWFSDHVHPNEAGYQVMAKEFFRAITQPADQAAAGASASSASPAPRLDRPVIRSNQPATNSYPDVE